MKARFISLLFLSATFTLSAAPTDRATLELLMADMAAVQYRRKHLTNNIIDKRGIM